MKKISCILLVEDDEVANFLNTTLIEMAGICERVKVTLNGQEALEYLRRNGCPDIIFLDIKMPVMNGVEFLDAFHREELPGKEKIRIFVLSSTANERDIDIIKTYNVPILAKPLTKEKLAMVAAGEM